MNKVEKEEIDLIDLIQRIWSNRSLILKVCGTSVIVGLIISFSIPKEYTTSVSLAPEAKAKLGEGNLGMLASMAGINLSASSGDDALSPELYPDIVKSTPFLLELFPVKIMSQDKQMNATLYEYMDKHQKAPWWSAITSAPIKLVGWMISVVKGEEENKSVVDLKPDAFQLTKKQAENANAISKRIDVSVDKKTGVISLKVTMQDPVVSAQITDTVMTNLQKYVTEYRTNKAKRDLEYTEKLYKEAQNEYYMAQQKYASFADTNKDIVLIGFRSKMERLQNEATLAYNLYNQLSQQLQMAKAKVQEVTPVYTVVQPASVPLIPASPNKIFIILSSILLAFAGTVAWILFLNELVDQLKAKMKSQSKSAE